ncbi:uncharacterized protein LOC126668368 [Mercurialis annua]|uniref:uncharacterized protein LOC126668368 n=1 Tax=Mercurialis annua TaxID=3986 RepID=UPI00215E3DB7|nr:uncharacterized protein LOC126668368 [Mercurialis annua]
MSNSGVDKPSTFFMYCISELMDKINCKIIVDPGLRMSIYDYDVGIRDQVRREYLLKGSKSDAFTKKGFNNWKKATESFNDNVGAVSSVHNDARRHCEVFEIQRQSISHTLTTQSRETENAYRTRLTAMLEVVRVLLWQGLAFRGHDETLDSLQRGNFLEIVSWYAKMDEKVRNVIGCNAPGNNQMTSPKIQKELVSSCASQVTLAILTELEDKKFSLLVDEARDCSVKEQMAVMLRFMNKKGEIIERFLAIEHLVVVPIAKHIPVVAEFFTNISMIVNIAGASCKTRDELNKHRDADIFEKLETGELTTGKGLNQQTTLTRPGDTRWGSHHATLARLLSM